MKPTSASPRGTSVSPWRPIQELVAIPTGWRSIGFLPTGKGAVDPVDLRENLAQISAPDGRWTLDFGYDLRRGFVGQVILDQDWSWPYGLCITRDPHRLVEWANTWIKDAPAPNQDDRGSGAGAR